MMPKKTFLSRTTWEPLRRFLAWWMRELANWVPARLRSWWEETGNIVLVTMEDDKVTFARPAAGQFQQIYQVDLASSSATALKPITAMQQLRGKTDSNARFLLCLSSTQVLRRSIVLPLAVEENLRQTLSFELDRYSPFKQGQAYFDYLVMARDLENKQLTAEIAVASRNDVDSAVQKLASIGLAISGAVVAEDLLSLRSGYRNLLPHAAREGGKPRTRVWWRIGFASVAFLLLVAVLAIPLWQKRATAIALLEPLAAAKQAAQETDAKRNLLNQLVDEHNLFPDRKWNSYSVVRVLDELAKLLPDDTFVIQFEFDGKSVQVQGESSSSSSLVETLEASQLLKDVGFKAQLIKIQGTAFDRFHVAAVLETPEKGLARPSDGKSPTTEKIGATTEGVPQPEPAAAAPLRRP